MPIYEFACPDCRVLYNFFSRRINTSTVPNCPKCGKPLSKQISLFQAKSGTGKDPDPWGMANDGCDDDFANAPDFNVNDERVAGAIEELGTKIDRMDDTDTEGAAKLMQEFSQKSGVKFSKDVNEALNRMAAGDDGDDVAATLGDALSSDNPFDTSLPTGTESAPKRETPFTKDPTLYEM